MISVTYTLAASLTPPLIDQPTTNTSTSQSFATASCSSALPHCLRHDVLAYEHWFLMLIVATSQFTTAISQLTTAISQLTTATSQLTTTTSQLTTATSQLTTATSQLTTATSQLTTTISQPGAHSNFLPHWPVCRSPDRLHARTNTRQRRLPAGIFASRFAYFA
ncbi:hypothetical protein FHG87_007082 [Trinorchestia longiramus]|nr:hypothetical protein FHG87_007082 [Trinorchestia longiramus]